MWHQKIYPSRMPLHLDATANLGFTREVSLFSGDIMEGIQFDGGTVKQL